MSLLSMCIQPSTKSGRGKKGHHHHHHHHHSSKKAPSSSVAPILTQFVSTGITTQQLEGPIVRKHPPQTILSERECTKPAPGKAFAHHHHQYPPEPYNHSNCENDSQKSAESHSTHTSGYQTDDGTFEGKMLRMATRSKPANIRMTAVKDYNPCCNEELALRKGQRVKVLYKNNDWVFCATKTGETGYVPYNFVRPSRKYAGYQSEPEYMADTDVYQSGYDTDMPMSNRRRYGPPRTQVGDRIPTYSIHTGFRESPEDHPRQQYGQRQYRQNQGSTRLGSGGSSPTSGPSSRIPSRYASGYTSAVECPPSPDSRWHPRPARSLHSIVDADDTPPAHTANRRPSEGKPGMDSFTREFLEELVVIHDFEAQEEDEVLISKGERVKVMNADDPFWLWVETTPGPQGFVPRSCCSLGNHPSLQSNSSRQNFANKQFPGSGSGSRNTRRYYYNQRQSRAQMAARQARTQAKQRFHELARQRNNAQNPVLMDKEEIQRIGSKLIVLMDYMAIQEDELSIQFAETVYADVLKQAGAERIWAYCPRSDQCGYVPLHLVVPPVI